MLPLLQGPFLPCGVLNEDGLRHGQAHPFTTHIKYGGSKLLKNSPAHELLTRPGKAIMPTVSGPRFMKTLWCALTRMDSVPGQPSDFTTHYLTCVHAKVGKVQSNKRQKPARGHLYQQTAMNAAAVARSTLALWCA